MDNWYQLAPFIVDTSGEPLFAAYEPWFCPPGTRIGITKSQYMSLAHIVAALDRGEITPEEAKLLESAFFLNGWTWVDQPERNVRTLQELLTKALLMQ